MNEYYPLNGGTLALDQAKCIGCGACADVCPHAVFEIVKRTGQEDAGNPVGKAASLSSGLARIESPERCMECGACALNCPADAISVSAGVGCAAAVVNRLLGRTGECSCGGPGETDSAGSRCC